MDGGNKKLSEIVSKFGGLTRMHHNLQEYPIVESDDLEAIKEVLDVMGEHGYTVQGAINLLKKCEFAILNCTVLHVEHEL